MSWGKRSVPWLVVLFVLITGSAAPSAAAGLKLPGVPSVQKPSLLPLRVAGHRIREMCTGTYEVVAGRTFTVTVIATDDASGAIRFDLERTRADGGWEPVSSIVRTLSDGRAVLALRATPVGRWRISAAIDGSHGAPDAAPIVLRYVAPRWRHFADGGVLLSVPWYHQQYRLSCEAATLRMAHNYHDPSSIDWDSQVLRVIGVDRRAKRNGRWGNPNTHFVGQPNGIMMRTGYGVHAGPIARAATHYDTCRPSVKLYRPSRQTIARHVDNGYPVIVWGAHAGRNGIRRLSWRAWDGAWIRAYEIEHTWVVVGFRGKVSNPTAFIIHDPSGRARRTVSAAQFYAFTKYFRTGVVVRG